MNFDAPQPNGQVDVEPSFVWLLFKKRDTTRIKQNQHTNLIVHKLQVQINVL